MTGGSFNRIIGIKVIVTNTDCPEQLILRVRIPRIAWMSRPDRGIAVLRSVRQHSSVSVPNIIKAFDLKSANVLMDPYVVQAGLLGQPFMQLYKTT